MLVRWVVNHLLRQAAQEKLQEAVAGVAQTAGAAMPVAVDEAGELPHIDLAFVFALNIECGGLVDRLEDSRPVRYDSCRAHWGRLDGRQVVIAESGVGAAASQAATTELIVRHQPRWLISSGFAGSLNESVRRGHIVMADHLVDLAEQSLDTGLRMDPAVLESARNLHLGRLLTVDRLIRNPDEKRRLGQTHQALACDMESFAVAQVCSAAGVRLMAIRVISDGVDDQLPRELDNLVQQKTMAAKLGAAAGAVLKRPSSVKDMWKLQQDAIKASERLAKFLSSILPQLAPPTAEPEDAEEKETSEE